VLGDCRQYTECLDGKSFNRTCEDVEEPYFDVVTKKCREKEEAQCFVQVARECTTEGSKYGVEGDCGAFKECVDGKLVVRKCDADVERPLFDVVSMECTDAEEAECFVASKGVQHGSKGLEVWTSFDN